MLVLRKADQSVQTVSYCALLASISQACKLQLKLPISHNHVNPDKCTCSSQTRAFTQQTSFHTLHHDIPALLAKVNPISTLSSLSAPPPMPQLIMSLSMG